MSDHNDKKTKTNEEGYGTTGHSWDGIEEWNNPLPRWWVWTFYLTIIWAVGYTIAYPAWPLVSQATGGLLGFSTRGQVAEEIAAVEERNAEIMTRLAEADLRTLPENDELHGFAVNAGRSVYLANCSQCHGQGAAGGRGFPNLIDDAWIWGGRIDEIAWTVAHGIRNEDSPDARWSQMPAYGDDGILTNEEIDQVVQHVLAISGQEHDAEMAAAGSEIFAGQCAACHGENGMGSLYQTRQAQEEAGEYYPDEEVTGAPNLTDAIWLYGGTEEDITNTVQHSRFGVMPAWSEEYRAASGLTQAEVNAVSAYVHQLGGGE